MMMFVCMGERKMGLVRFVMASTGVRVCVSECVGLWILMVVK